MPAPPLALNAWLRWDVVSRLLPPDAKTVLEIGCGGGGFGYRLAQRYDYLGVEPDGTSYALARQRLAQLGRGEVRHGMSFEVVEPEREFDALCAFEVLEHMADDVAAAREWLSHLAVGGYILVSTPAFQERFGPADTYAGHYRRYSPDQMIGVLQDAGFTSVEVILYGMPLGYLLEPARHYVLGRRLSTATVSPGGSSDHYSATVTAPPDLMAERTSDSARLLQPSEWMAPFTQVGTAPFRLLQRAFPAKGTGLVARARKPA